MKPIPLRILNKSVTVILTGQTIGDTGSVNGGDTTVYANLPMRINKAKGDDKIKEQGMTAFSSYLGICRCTMVISNVDTAIVIKTGHIVIDGSDRYKVDFVDSNPGGLVGHHQEIFMSILGK